MCMWMSEGNFYGVDSLHLSLGSGIQTQVIRQVSLPAESSHSNYSAFFSLLTFSAYGIYFKLFFSAPLPDFTICVHSGPGPAGLGVLFAEHFVS